MVRFEEIDSRLTAIGKNRAWLASVTPYSADYIRTVLAPNSTRRTERVMEILSAAIEKEEARSVPELPDRLTLEVTPAEYDAYSEAALSQRQTLKRWAIDELNRAAEAYQKSNRYESHEAWQARQETLRVAEDEREYGKSSRSGPA
jgi:hypothetical protein